MQSNRKIKAAFCSVISNTSLVILKLSVGIISGSVSVMSEAIHSGVDLLASLIAWVSVKISAKPADAGHQYGHGKFENVSGTIEALLIFLAAGWIIFEAIQKLLNPTSMEQLGFSIIVMVISVIANWLISNYLMQVGHQTDSVALIADAWHLRTDVYTSAGVMIALVTIWIGQIVFPTVNLSWIDPLAAIAVAILIIHAALKLTMQASRDLVDVSLPVAELHWLEDYLRSLSPTVKGFHNLRTRKAGSARFIEVHIVVDGNMSVNASHAITKEINKAIWARFTEVTVTVHIEPCDYLEFSTACKEHCLSGCMVDKL